MDRRQFLYLAASAALSGCGFWRVDPWSVLIRSDEITSPEREKEVLSKGHLAKSADGRIRVLYTEGTPYEIGYQHGALLRDEVADNLSYLYESAVDKFRFEELFDECYERMRPFISADYVDEMHGLAHGARIPLRQVHGFHALPEIGEWGGKKRIAKLVKRMMAGEEMGTTCSNLCATGAATADGKTYVVRILDWGLHRISKLHEYPLIHVSKPTGKIPFANIGWVGFLGAISGINQQKITLGEMGYGDHEHETLRGKPMPFLLRDILSDASSLKDVRRIIQSSPGTNSFVYLMSDGKTRDGELYIRDRNRFEVYKAGTEIIDEKGRHLPGIQDLVYGGHYREKMGEILKDERGKITPERLMNDIIPKIVMPSNFQNVIYSPETLEFWVSNASSPGDRAAEQPYTYFNFGEALASKRANI